MVPPGMKRIFLGSNPIAFGAPGGREPPGIIDMSTTHAAWGKVIVARQEGKPALGIGVVTAVSAPDGYLETAWYDTRARRTRRRTPG